MKKYKKFIWPVASVALVVAVMLSGAYSYLSAKDTKSNTINVGMAEISLTETNWVNTDGSLVNDTNKNSINDDAENVLPGDSFTDVNFKVTNSSNCDIYIYAVIRIPTTTGDGYHDYTSEEYKVSDVDVTVIGIQNKYHNKTGAANLFAEYGYDPDGAATEDTDNEDYDYFFRLERNTGWKEMNWPGESYNTYLSTNGYLYFLYVYDVKPGTSTIEVTPTTTTETTNILKSLSIYSDIGERATTPYDCNQVKELKVQIFVRTDCLEDTNTYIASKRSDSSTYLSITSTPLYQKDSDQVSMFSADGRKLSALISAGTITGNTDDYALIESNYTFTTTNGEVNLKEILDAYKTKSTSSDGVGHLFSLCSVSGVTLLDYAQNEPEYVDRSYSNSTADEANTFTCYDGQTVCVYLS